MKVSYIRPKNDFIPDGMYVFSKTVALEKAEKYKINIFTTGRYILKINGSYICEGPCKSHEYVRYYDSLEADAFVVGENKIEIIVMHINGDRSFTTVYKTQKPEVIFEAVSESNRIASDENWRCTRDLRYTLSYAGMMSLPPFENVDFSRRTVPVEIETAGELDFGTGVDAPYGVSWVDTPEERPILMLFPGEKISFSVVKKGDGFLELDAGCYTTAKLEFLLRKNSSVKIIYSECYENKNGKGMRDDASGFLRGEDFGAVDFVQTTDRDEVYSPFWFRAFRFIRVEAEDVENVLKSISGSFWHYPIAMQGKFHCSDESLNKMWDVSVNTMLCCAHETFYDCPYYEQQQYDMDSAIEAAVMAGMTDDMRLVRKTIEEFAASQQASGLILANYPATYRQIIPGFSFFWIFMLADYLERTRDILFVRKFIGNVDKILTYFDSCLSKDGLVVSGSYWDFVDWVPEWERGEPVRERNKPITVYTMYYACALLMAASICKKVGRAGLGDEYIKRYEQVKLDLKTHCFDSTRGLYRDGENGGYSMHTIMWAVLAELVTGDEARKMMSHLNDPDVSKSGFAMNYYLFRAFERCGMREKIFENLCGWQKMLDMHCTTWCENPDSPRSECHAWSSAPLHELSSNVLGVKVGFDDEIVIAPYVPEWLTLAKGVVPTRFGSVSVSWTNDKNGFNISMKLPDGVRKRLIMPDGEVKILGEDVTEI